MRSMLQHVFVLLARIFLSLFFLWSAVNIMLNWQASREALISQEVPVGWLLLGLEVALLLVGGLLLMIGLWGRLGAVLLMVFLVPDTLVLHNDWSWLGKVSLSGLSAHADQITHCLRNLGLLGGLLMVLGFGSGGFSIDLFREGKRKVVG